MVLCLEDLQQKRAKIMFDPQFSQSMRNEYISHTLPLWLTYFERLIAGDSIDWYFTNGPNYDGPYFASGRLTWLDYLMFDMIESNCNFLEHTIPLIQEGITLDNETVLDLPDNCFQLLERHPHLSIFANNFKNRVNIAAYVNSGRRTPYRSPLPN